MSLRGRLHRLEERGGSGASPEDALRREVLRRMAAEELDAYEVAVARYEAGEDPTEANRTIAARVEAIRKEAKNEPLPAS